MTENLSIKLSEGLRNLVDVFVDLSKQIEKDDAEYFDLVRKHAELEVKYEKLEKEKDRLEYDKKYFANELLKNRE